MTQPGLARCGARHIINADDASDSKRTHERTGSGLALAILLTFSPMGSAMACNIPCNASAGMPISQDSIHATSKLPDQAWAFFIVGNNT